MYVQIITYDTKLEIFTCIETEIEIISIKSLNLKLDFYLFTYFVQVLLANRLDGENHFKYTAITVPLYISLLTLIGLSFGAKGGNHCE